jgi:hypothetical protein
MYSNQDQFRDVRASDYRTDSDDKSHADSMLEKRADVPGHELKNKELFRRMDENNREFDTRDALRDGMTVKEAEERAARGRPVEISGDARARFEAGKPGKYHSGEK